MSKFAEEYDDLAPKEDEESEVMTKFFTDDMANDNDGSRSLYRLLNGMRTTQQAIRQIPSDLFEKTERELLRKPDSTQMRLKISFWNEYRNARTHQNFTAMRLANVLHGICTPAYWYEKVCKDYEVLAWIITPPVSETVVWQELIQLGQDKIRRVLKLPLIEKRYWKDKYGEVHVEKRINVALIKEIRGIVEKLQDRMHGTVVQRQLIESKTMRVNVDATPKPKEMSATEEMAVLDKMISRIEQAEKNLAQIPGVVVDGVVEEQDAAEDDEDFV